MMYGALDSVAQSPIPLGSAVAALPIPSDIAGIDAEIATLTTASAGTPQSVTARTDRLEALWKARAGAAQGGEDSPTEVPEGFEPPASPLAYTLENALPPGADIVDQAGLGALKSGLHAMGVPAEIASAGFAEIAHLHAQGTFASEAAYDQQVQLCRNAMHKVHGENAPAMIRDGLAAVDAAVRAGHLTESAAEAIIASPMALSKAAEFRRFGGKARK